MEIIVNDEKRAIADGLTLLELVQQMGLAPERVAVELNREVARRGEWAATVLYEKDRLEIVHFVGGG